jgi:hypothetical protein
MFQLSESAAEQYRQKQQPLPPPRAAGPRELALAAQHVSTPRAFHHFHSSFKPRAGRSR